MGGFECIREGRKESGGPGRSTLRAPVSTSQTPSRTPHGASRRTLALAAAVAAAVLVVAIVLISNGGGGGAPSTPPGAIPPKPTPRGGPVPKPGDLYVDVSSRGGRCDDSRGAAAVRSRRTPWCTAQRAVDAAPAGAAVFLRGGSYPAVKVAERADRKRPVTIAGY